MLTPAQRAAHMATVRPRGNRSTEQVVVEFLEAGGFTGWVQNPKDVLGKPDFYFAAHRVAVFVDGCFWHGCPKCRRNLPATRPEFWKTKFKANRRRDARVTRELRAEGVVVMRIWEHALRAGKWRSSLRGVLTRARRRSEAAQTSPPVER